MEKRYKLQIPILGGVLYLVALTTISQLFKGHAMQPLFMAWGIGEVFFFFVLSWLFFLRWKDDDPKRFTRKVFFTALAIRAVYAFLMCYYFYRQTGYPFEYYAADSLDYHRTAVYLSRCIRQGHIGYFFKYLNAITMGFSDQGYITWLTLIYTIFGPNVLTPRLFKAIMSAIMCLALYRLGSRTFDEKTGRMAAVFCVFMPTLIHITGLHTKECEMIFLMVLALERMDYLIRSKHYTVWNILFPIVLVGLSFGFRTVIGMTLLFAFLVFTVLSDGLATRKTKIITIAATAVVFLAFLFTPIGKEMNIVYRLKFKDNNYLEQKYEQEGMRLAGLAQNIYMAPGAFVLPLSSMVIESNENQKMMNGSMYVKNWLAFFAMWAIVLAIKDKRWRNFSLIGGFELSYLFIIMFSFAANSERYHQPAIPCILLMAAYSLTHLGKKGLRFYYVYCVLLLLALVGWNWIKLSARGII